MSPLRGSIYTHSSKRSTRELSATSLPRHSSYASSKVTCTLSVNLVDYLEDDLPFILIVSNLSEGSVSKLLSV
jgi:hypothetical protein